MPELNPDCPQMPHARQEGDALIITLTGDIDLHASPDLRNALIQLMNKTNPTRLIFNLGGVPYMDSSAMAVMVEALQRLRKTGGQVILTDLQPRVKGLLEIARLNSIFTIVANEAQALQQ